MSRSIKHFHSGVPGSVQSSAGLPRRGSENATGGAASSLGTKAWGLDLTPLEAPQGWRKR
jgi:hypothetical protein